MKVEQELREKLLEYANRLKEKDREFAEEIIAKIDDFVSWFMENKREMTLEEFTIILEG